MTNVVDCSITIYSPWLIKFAGVKFVGFIRRPDQRLLLHYCPHPSLIFNLQMLFVCLLVLEVSLSRTEPLFPVHKPASTQMLSRPSLDKPAQ